MSERVGRNLELKKPFFSRDTKPAPGSAKPFSDQGTVGGLEKGHCDLVTLPLLLQPLGRG